MASLLCWAEVDVLAPAILEAVMWCPSSSFSLWGQGSCELETMHRGATWQKGKEERVKEDKMFNKKCSSVTVLDMPSLL